MKDCFMGLHSCGGWLTFFAAIVSSSTSNSSSSSSRLSLGFCRIVHLISISIGRMVGFLDLSPCMNRTKFGSYSSFSTTVLISLELRLISEGCALERTTLDRSWPTIDRNHRNYSAAIWNKQKKKKKKRIEIKQNSSKTKLNKNRIKTTIKKNKTKQN
jgi:hypothetical protein